MKDLNMKRFCRHEIPLNRKESGASVNLLTKTDITVNKKVKKIKKSTKNLFSSGGMIENRNKVSGFVFHNDISEVGKAPIIDYDFMVNSDKTSSLLYNNKSKKY
jgi:hypothetical protein